MYALETTKNVLINSKVEIKITIHYTMYENKTNRQNTVIYHRYLYIYIIFYLSVDMLN